MVFRINLHNHLVTVPLRESGSTHSRLMASLIPCVIHKKSKQRDSGSLHMPCARQCRGNGGDTQGSRARAKSSCFKSTVDIISVTMPIVTDTIRVGLPRKPLYHRLLQ